MKSVTVRLTLLILFIAASAATGYFIWTSQTDLRSATDGARRFDNEAVAAGRGVLELRAAQQAYVAAGQGEQFWTAKAAAALTDLKASIGAIRAQSASPRAQTAIDSALAVLQDFEQVDKRAREYALSGQKLIASDLIFSDGLEMTGATLAALEQARSAEREDYEQASATVRQTELIAVGSCGALALLVIGMLVPFKGDQRTQLQNTPRSPAALAGSYDSEPLDLALTLDGDADEWATASRRTIPEPAPSPPALDLDSIASLCTDLARVADTRSLPSILERTAAVLNASGIIVWIADPDGRELTPIVAYGYSAHVLSRLGRIGRDAQNVTAAAFRTGLVQTIKADAVSNGAIAAPLMTAPGAVGVMAAEVRNESALQAAKLAAASIVAAQLATLVGPPVSREPMKEIAGG